MKGIMAMKNQTKKVLIDAIYKVIDSAPTQYNLKNYPFYQNNYYTCNINNELSEQEFNTWLNYACQILDILYNHTGLDFILSEKNKIFQLVNQCHQLRIPYIQCVLEINKELLNLAKEILNY